MGGGPRVPLDAEPGGGEVVSELCLELVQFLSLDPSYGCVPPCAPFLSLPHPPTLPALDSPGSCPSRLLVATGLRTGAGRLCLLTSTLVAGQGPSKKPAPCCLWTLHGQGLPLALPPPFPLWDGEREDRPEE